MGKDICIFSCRGVVRLVIEYGNIVYIAFNICKVSLPCNMMLIKLLNITEYNARFQHPLRTASFSKCMKVNSIYKMLLPGWEEFKLPENAFILKVGFESVPYNQIWNHYKKG